MTNRASLRYRRAAERVHALGPRVVGELLTDAGVPLARVEVFAALDRFHPALLDSINISGWAPSLFAVAST